MGLRDLFRRKKEEEEPEFELVQKFGEEKEERRISPIVGPRGEELKAIDFDEVTEPDLGEVREEFAEMREEVAEAREEKTEEVAKPVVKTEQELRKERIAGIKARIEEKKAEKEEEALREPTRREKIVGAGVGVMKGVGLGAVDVGRGFRRKAPVGKAPERVGVADRVQRAVYKTATLGGAVHLTKARRHLYVPKTQMALYETTGMRGLTTPAFGKMRALTTLGGRRTDLVGGSPLAQATPRPLSRMTRQTGQVRVGLGAQDMAMERLRGLGFPGGLSQTEKMAYAEIRANHDIDTKSHVISELMDMGIERREAIQAVEELMKRKVIRWGRPFKGEPTLEVVR